MQTNKSHHQYSYLPSPLLTLYSFGRTLVWINKKTELTSLKHTEKLDVMHGLTTVVYVTATTNKDGMKPYNI